MYLNPLLCSQRVHFSFVYFVLPSLTLIILPSPRPTFLSFETDILHHFDPAFEAFVFLH